MTSQKVTIQTLKNKKIKNEKITMLTAYDYSTALLLDEAGVDSLLVGDSLGNVILGYASTVPVTMEEMLHHCKAVTRAARRALVIGDMPFMSYNIGREETIRNAGRFLKEAGCDAVKLEGGSEMAPMVREITRAGIPVVGHIGFTPQTASQLAGTVQGRDEKRRAELVHSARELEAAGAFMIVIECVPDEIARQITQAVAIPIIGIGAGPDTDGQVLVTNDMLGLFEKFTPSFVKKYANLAPQIREAVSSYIHEVKEVKFPDAEHTFKMTK